MLKRIPIVAVPIGIGDLFSGFNASRKTAQQYIASPYLFFANSATACLYSFFKGLNDQSGKDEVILPAYTASTLVVAIQKAGLKPVLCDISLDDFNLNADLLKQVVTEKTLAIIGVHMFGIVDTALADIKKQFPEVIIIEDCAQAMGSKINGEFVGRMSDVSLFSFNRGKNIPTYGGGCLGVNNEALIENMQQMPEQNTCIVGEIKAMVKLTALALVMRPQIYTMVLPLIRGLKEKAPALNFEVKGYAKFQLGVAGALFKKIGDFSEQRYANGKRLIAELQETEGIFVPKIAENTQPAFNRLPVLFKDIKKRNQVAEELAKVGIETSRMYFKPLHHLFDLGYEKEEFPKACYLAEHLLTLPTHPLLTDNDIDKIIATVKK
ncbi:MAG: hypothetical protein GY853_12915 [PVC group bacterium]|nr:hypothetical protein [PVC group bacterium]